MPKLHEILAVARNLETQATKTRTELAGTFEKKRHLFAESLVTFVPVGADAEPVTEKQSGLQTTVKRELKWIKPFLANAMDAKVQIDVANNGAKADVILETGKTLLTDIPGISLLELEKRMEELHAFVAQIPTLDPAKDFTAAPDRGNDIFQARPDVRTRTAKVQKALVLYPATDKHPAQTQLVSEDVPTGKVTTQEWSGMITTTEKGEILERVEILARAIKKARSRANDIVVPEAPKVGDVMLSYVFGL